MSMTYIPLGGLTFCVDSTLMCTKYYIILRDSTSTDHIDATVYKLTPFNQPLLNFFGFNELLIFSSYDHSAISSINDTFRN